MKKGGALHHDDAAARRGRPRKREAGGGRPSSSRRPWAAPQGRGGGGEEEWSADEVSTLETVVLDLHLKCDDQPWWEEVARRVEAHGFPERNPSSYEKRYAAVRAASIRWEWGKRRARTGSQLQRVDAAARGPPPPLLPVAADFTAEEAAAAATLLGLGANPLLSSGPAMEFADVTSFDDFHVTVDGLIIDSSLTESVRRGYYELCVEHHRCLHVNLLHGLSLSMVVGAVVELTSVAEAIRSCEGARTPSDDQLVAWAKTLESLVHLGMDVGSMLRHVRDMAEQRVQDLQSRLKAAKGTVHMLSGVDAAETSAL